jgi:RNA polymerase sporulation-specific sigma factor
MEWPSHKNERGKKINEEEITVLVTHVRENGNESAFQLLQTYLNYYIKLFGRKYRIPGCDSDEIEQECLYALRYKAIEDFNPDRGKFKSFAILCIKRHLFSLIKGNNQLKRKVLNTSLSLDEDRSEGGESLSLISIITEDAPNIDDKIAKDESHQVRQNRLLARLSALEQEVFKLYLQQLHYDEIVESLKKVFPDKRITKKTVDNSLQRIRQKAQNMQENIDW